MGRRKRRQKFHAQPAQTAQAAAPTGSNSPLMFRFGDPDPVLGNDLSDYLGTFLEPHGDYYVPPISQTGLVNLLGANAHHGTIPYFKRNMLRKWYLPNDALKPDDLANAGFDHSVLGHCYFQVVYNHFGQVLRLQHLPALNMRRMKEADRYCMLRPNGNSPVEFEPGEVIQLKEYDPKQQIYGRPQYLGGVQSVLLNEDSTLFRRRYYRNGAHMGYIFYTADPSLNPEDEKLIKEKVQQSKGVGNFRSMYINIPNGKEKSVQIIPVGDIATKDEFERVKNLSRNDVLAMWRIQPALAGVMPENSGGFGDIEKISRVYYENEVIPMQDVFAPLNEYLPAGRKIKFMQPQDLTDG
ncbi:phage portal protein [Microbulbifer taiwanensis]|uniref:Phage portal protein n=1 Tax=Microbulbifer taiwanensis TaxID=986746 RepID=A0ABW1YLH5_9GAMM|nr:phage portal protein [Microbulbifer taiwanensis]